MMAALIHALEADGDSRRSSKSIMNCCNVRILFKKNGEDEKSVT